MLKPKRRRPDHAMHKPRANRISYGRSVREIQPCNVAWEWLMPDGICCCVVWLRSQSVLSLSKSHTNTSLYIGYWDNNSLRSLHPSSRPPAMILDSATTILVTLPYIVGSAVSLSIGGRC